MLLKNLCFSGPVKSRYANFLNQARTGRRPARAWFLEITFVRDVCMRVCVCVCVRPRGY